MIGLDLPPASPRIAVSAVIEAASAYYDVDRADLMGSGGDKTLIRRRQVARFVAARLTTIGYPKVARMFGTATTAIHEAVNRIEALSETNEQVAVDARIIATLVTEVVARQRLASQLKQDSDPLARAIDIVSIGAARARISTDDIEAMARCLIGYARTIGDLTVEGEPAEDAPEPLAPETMAITHARTLLTRVLAVARARDALNSAKFSRGEKAATERLEGALARLVNHARLVSATLKDVSHG